MNMVTAFILVLATGLILVLTLKEKWKNSALYGTLLLNSLLTSYLAVEALYGRFFSLVLPGNLVTGNIPVCIDSLSGWFVLIINLVFLTGGFYGIGYLKSYREEKNKLILHRLMFLLLHASLILLTSVQNSLVFLIGWELMTLSAFITIIFEHEKSAVIKAGLNFLIQSHVSLVFLMMGFIWVASGTGSYGFDAIASFSSQATPAVSLGLTLCFLVGFGIKAGFVPFHTWLPYAHPAAPAHISGIMSGVIIKIGIFGILRMLLLIPVDYTTIGYILLVVSVISGVYGVMLAIMQHNLKKLLAYHSIENIGIIGIGLGIGCVGLGSENQLLATLGFAGALLHTLNHALFKSLLFYAAGNVYQATHTLHIEHLGGLMKKMPHTALLFLLAAIAISGIPPFNGFVSEFLIYSGLYDWLHNADLVPLVAVIFTILGLVLIGGLALMCFTKAFGVVFLGSPRQQLHLEAKEVPLAQRMPLYVIAALIVAIGLFPQLFLSMLSGPLSLYSINPLIPAGSLDPSGVATMKNLSWMAGGFLGMVILLYWVRRILTKGSIVETGPTWGCGYVAPNARQQYTAGSFVRSYSKLFRGLLMSSRREKGVEGIYPEVGYYESHSYDKLESYLIDKPVMAIRYVMGRFSFLQNGRLQVYILYGILFITLVIIAPVAIRKLLLLFEFLKQL